jgi:hypothetical protein
MKSLLIISCCLLPGSLSMGQDEEVVPKIINYQGKLTDANSFPIAGQAGGTFRLRFEIFPQAEEGAAVWAEERDAVVIGGVFNVALGGAGGAAVGQVSNDLGAAFAQPQRFLQTTIVSGPTISAPQTLAPRQQLASTPFAFVAQTADRAAVAALAESLLPHLAQALNPPGTVIVYAGAVEDTGGLVEPIPGYLLCNGAVIDGAASNGKFNTLRTVLGNAWGNGGSAANEQLVNLPDLRGVFLRGWNGLATDGFADPDITDAKRTFRKTGGNVGNRVGSFQMDAFQGHHHLVKRRTTTENPENSSASGRGLFLEQWDTFSGTDSVAANEVRSATTDASFGSARVSSETRSKNANVVYLIKY